VSKRRVVVIGAGGFAREVKWLIQEMNAATPAWEFGGYVVSDLQRLGVNDSRSEVLGDYGWLRENRGRFDGLALGIGTPVNRLKVANELLPEFPDDWWPPLVHPTVRYDASTTRIEAGSILCAGVMATVHIRVGKFALVNLCCTLGHEAVVGAGCVLNPSSNISGGVILEDGVLVGTGGQVLQYLRVGRGATVGAGSVVTKDVADGMTVVGIPAKPLFRKD